MDPSYLIYNKSVISNGWEERKFYPHLAAYTSMHCESIRDLNIENEIIQVLQENISEFLYNLGEGKVLQTIIKF